MDGVQKKDVVSVSRLTLCGTKDVLRFIQNTRSVLCGKNVEFSNVNADYSNH